MDRDYFRDFTEKVINSPISPLVFLLPMIESITLNVLYQYEMNNFFMFFILSRLYQLVLS